jgi:dUTP pyrophosphatase
VYRISEFYKVDFEIFAQGYKECVGEIEEASLKQIYDSIILPKRATIGSAGYDFILPYSITVSPGQTVRIPTGIRSKIDEGWALFLFPRSSLGFKYRFQLDNTVGIIDSDYYNSDNQGHILAKITNDSRDGKTMELAQGQAFMQGIFLPYGITMTDKVDAMRNGGLGSTDN